MTAVTFLSAVGGDNSTVSDDTNPTTGLGAGGHRTRFVPALVQLVAVAQFMVSAATGVSNGVFTPCRLMTIGNDSLSGLAARDGVTPVAGDRVFVPSQTAGSANGIYVAAAGAWARATDANLSGNFAPNKMVGVSEGTTGAGTVWYLATPGPITLNATALAFAALPSKTQANIWSAIQTFGGAATFNAVATFNAATTFAAAINMSGAPINEALGANIASAATINLEAATGSIVDITGTTGITAITLSAGHERKVRFTGSLTLTASASLILPTSAPTMTTNANDTATIRGYAGGVVQFVAYTKVSGLANAGTSGRLLRTNYYKATATTSYSGSFSKGADSSFIIAKFGSSGAPGGNCTATAGAASSGGGGGAYIEAMIATSNLQASETFILGPGNSNGYNSNFSSGAVSVLALLGGTAGSSASVASTVVAPGVGGTLSSIGTGWTTLLYIPGSDGTYGISTGSVTSAAGGNGGGSYGGGGASAPINTGNGNSAVGQCGGGSGCKGATASNGGLGGGAFLLIEEYS